MSSESEAKTVPRRPYASRGSRADDRIRGNTEAMASMRWRVGLRKRCVTSATSSANERDSHSRLQTGTVYRSLPMLHLSMLQDCGGRRLEQACPGDTRT